MSDNNLVSVILPVHNGAKYLRQTLESLSRQTYNRFELIVIDDASSDATAGIVANFTDPRIRYIRNDQQLGVSRTLLRGIHHSSGAYVARMDADDVCFPRRFERQVQYLKANPEIAVLGGAAVLIGHTAQLLRTMPSSNDAIRARMLLRSPLIHPSVMFRRDAIPEWYDPTCSAAEDYELWVRLALRGIRFANLRIPVIKYRIHAGQVSGRRAAPQSLGAAGIREDFLERVLGYVQHADVDVVSRLASRCVTIDQVASVLRVVSRLVEANRKSGFFDEAELRRLLEREILINMAHLGNEVWRLRSAEKAALRQIARRRPRAVAYSLVHRTLKRRAVGVA